RGSRRRTDSAGLEDRFHCSACGFVAGFGVMLSGELKDSRRGDDLRSGRLQYRGLAGCVLVREDLTEVAQDRTAAKRRQLRVFGDPGAECLAAHSLAAEARCGLGGFSVYGRMRVLALDAVGEGWFSGAQGLDPLVGVAAAEFGVGCDGQETGVRRWRAPILGGRPSPEREL